MTTAISPRAAPRARGRPAAVIAATALAVGLVGLGIACSSKPTASAASSTVPPTTPASLAAAPVGMASGSAAPLGSSPSDPAGGSTLRDSEQTMLTMVNDLRASRGIAPLAHDPSLALVARRWSAEMAETESFKHNSDYSSQYPPGWHSAAENIALGETSGTLTTDAIQRLVSIAFDTLADSPGHHANMTDPRFTHVGVGMALGYSTLWTTQNFAEYPGENDRDTD